MKKGLAKNQFLNSIKVIHQFINTVQFICFFILTLQDEVHNRSRF